uniref:Uncharacterized protein n=1 Tax=Strongyloides papillosus TaxID=174720 RepID=A0A0N5BEF7_STREA
MPRTCRRYFDGLRKKKDFEHGILKNMDNGKIYEDAPLLSQKHPVPLQVYYNKYTKKGKKSNISKSKKVKPWYGIKHKIYYTGETVLSFFHFDWAEMFSRLRHEKCELFKELGVMSFKNPRVPYLPTIYEIDEDIYSEF